MLCGRPKGHEGDCLPLEGDRQMWLSLADSCAESGVPLFVEDRQVLQQIATLLAPVHHKEKRHGEADHG